jgi:beta-phosphoglucomutase-like phosphatase (HAD superfamily)
MISNDRQNEVSATGDTHDDFHTLGAPKNNKIESSGMRLAVIQRLSLSDAIFDLDQTLVRSREFHIGLFKIACAQFGVNNQDFDDHLVPVYNQNRGASYSVIIENVFNAAERLVPHAPNWTPRERRDALFDVSQKVLEDQNHDLRKLIKIIPGAPEIFEHVKDLGLSIRICTGSPREIAQTLLEIAGYKVEPHQLVCHGDLDVDKHDGAYWDTVLQSVDRECCIGFDDTPQGAQWLLEVAKIKLVCIVSSGLDFAQRLEELRQSYPERLILANKWLDFLSFNAD